ncbi:hypothetical protein DRF65_27830 [Chryseobacterium pennae]|uniref:Uncharacterized protein n=1 Tax=Chryseobacterium pennae TaxID=2258962 RepID=A0A3D9C012_9FLAO|nr:hypothetical protein [Chryseobacterium pennae]REC59088.1 hypothetical protein DRF65_27830 [Chryseobacterium pennae]
MNDHYLKKLDRITAILTQLQSKPVVRAQDLAVNLKHCEELFKKHHLKYVLIKQQYTQGNITATWRLTGKNTHHEELIKDLVDDVKIIAYQF